MKNPLLLLTRHHAASPNSGRAAQNDNIASGAPASEAVSQGAGPDAQMQNGRQQATCANQRGQPHQELTPRMHDEKREDGGSGNRETVTSEKCYGDCTAEHEHRDTRPDGKPHFFSLCTKCGNDEKDKSQRERREPARGFITRSESYINASCASRWEVDALCGEPPHGKERGSPVFDRSKFVQETQLDGSVTINDIFDFSHGQNLGKGSYGSVIRARDFKTGTTRAIKIVYKPRIENVTRLKREILIMKRLDHPNIIKLFEVYEDDKNLYLVMELCTGGELFERIIKSGHFSERYAACLMRQVFSAAAYCHANNVMHRDLKPENLLYADTSPLSALKVIDWGFAARCGRSHKFTSVVGTPYYVAPEVLFGTYGSECDVWSTGVVLYILLCGYPPFHGKDNQAILKKVQAGEYSFDPRHWKRISEQAKDLVRRCLTYVPSKRITAQEALQHPWIQSFAAGHGGVEYSLSLRLGSDLIERFKGFQRLHKLKRLAITCVAYQLSDSEIGMLHDAFRMLDKNADGVLTVSEIQQGLEQCGVEGDDVIEVLKELDTDGNGTIDYTEFIAASLDHKIYEQESACQNAFRVLDLDGDGKISMEELQKVVESSRIKEAFNKEAALDMIREGDLNNDGMIDFDEFIRMMRGRQRRSSESASPLARARALLYRRYDN